MTSASGHADTTSNVVRAGRPASRTAMRVRRCVERPIGASTTPRGAVGSSPHERQVVALDVTRARARRRAARRRAAVRATTSRPLVSRSSRCTMPGRERSPTSAISGYRASSPWTSVPCACPAPGMHDEPGRLVDDDDVVVVVAHVDRHASATGSRRRHPARRGPRRRLAAREAVALRRRPRPPTSTVAVAQQRLDLGSAPAGEQRHRAVDALPGERLRDDDRVVVPIGCVTPRRHHVRGSARRSSERIAEDDPEHEEHRADRDRGVGDVERREAADVHEVDHRAPEEARRARRRGRRGCRSRPRARARARPRSTGRRLRCTRADEQDGEHDRERSRAAA